MRRDKEKAVELRKKSKSYNEISRALGIPKSTLAGWLSRDPVSRKIKATLTIQAAKNSRQRIKNLIEANRARWAQQREKAREEAFRDFPYLKRNPLFVAGLMLYWAEGDNKPGNPFRLTNTNSKIISLYTKFLVDVLKIPKENIRCGLILYPDLSEKICLSFWSQIIGIPKTQFYKTQVIGGRHPSKRLSNGICMIICGNRLLKEKVFVWLDLLSKNLVK
ncbi:MAG: helix-turn-helix domain-containing protein [Patescibacteria group bacterium]